MSGSRIMKRIFPLDAGRIRSGIIDTAEAVSTLASRAGLALAAYALVAMVTLVLIEIVLRGVFATSTFVLEEFLGYSVAATTFLTLGSALAHGALIRVSLLLGRLGPQARRQAEVVSLLAALFCTGFLGWFILLKTLRDFGRGTVSATIAQVPVWIPETVVLSGLLIFALQLLARLAFVGLADVDRIAAVLDAEAAAVQDELG